MSGEKLLKDFRLLGNIIRRDEKSAFKVDLCPLESIIEEDIPEAFRRYAPPDFFSIYDLFCAEYAMFKNFVLYDALIGKSVVALGGGFSSGKSSFLNAIDGEKALPWDINPSTAVPAFIVNGEKHSAFGYNLFDSIVEMELPDFRKISHSFGELRDEAGNLLNGGVMLGHVLENVFLATPKQAYKNIAFVDTPGFSKPDRETKTDRTDEQIARSQLDAATYNMIFVPANAGTLRDQDADFIKKLREDIPKLFILSKADTKPAAELDAIREHLHATLKMKGIPYLDVLAFSADDKDGFDAEKIREYLSKWNETATPPRFARNFKKLFLRCRKFFEGEKEGKERSLERLNKALLLIDSDDAQVTEPLQEIVKELRKAITGLKDTLAALIELKNGFFSEIKKISDQVGIEMPDPSEVELVDDAADLMKIALERKKKTEPGKSSKSADILRAAFESVIPVFDSLPGGSAYAAATAKTIRACAVNNDEIRINAPIFRGGRYQEIIHSWGGIAND